MDDSQIYAMMREKGLRITPQKKAILDLFLANQDRMLSVNDVCNMLPEGVSIDNATVYRNMQKFLDFGILEFMNDDNGINRYTFCKRGHHHYLICTECGRIMEFPCARNYWETYASSNRFTVTYHKLEIYGKCFDCRDCESRNG